MRVRLGVRFRVQVRESGQVRVRGKGCGLGKVSG
jgi:hypothetical protein